MSIRHTFVVDVLAVAAACESGPRPLSEADKEAIRSLESSFAKLAVLRQSWDAAGPALTIVAALGGVFGALFYLRPVPDLLAGRGAEGDAGSRTPLGVRVAIAVGGAAFVLCMVVPQVAVRFAS